MTDYIIQILPSMIEGLGVSAEIFALTLVLTTEAVVGEIPEKKPAVPPMPAGGMGGMM